MHELQGLEVVLVPKNSEWSELLKWDMVLCHSYSQAVSVTDILRRPDTSFFIVHSLYGHQNICILLMFVCYSVLVCVRCLCVNAGACVNVCLLSSEGKMKSWLPPSTFQWALPRQHASLGLWNKCLSCWPISVTQEESWAIKKKTPFLATRWSLCHRIT